MPIEEYCIGVLAKEMPASYSKEALKAQAVVVRTEVYRKIKETGKETVLEGVHDLKIRIGVTSQNLLPVPGTAITQPEKRRQRKLFPIERIPMSIRPA